MCVCVCVCVECEQSHGEDCTACCILAAVVGQLEGLRWRGVTGELATLFTITGSSPWLLLTMSGANHGLGLSSQLGPVVCSLGSGDIQT